MATQEKILNQLQILTNISQEGSYSDTFISALRNIFLTEIDNIEQQIKDIKIDLKAFEQQYKMSSEQFYEQFEKGILGDDIDFVEWKAYYQMWHSLPREIKSTSISVIKMISQNYINKIKEILNTSKIIETVEIVKEKAIQDQGYFRAKITLKNGDFLEVAEFFKIENKQCISADYRYQWMNVNKEKLIKRWDNVKHFPDLANFPHHVHISDESIVKPSKLRSTIEIISLIEQKILKKNN